MSLQRLPPPPYLPILDDWLDLTTFCSELKRVLAHESTDCLPSADLQQLFLSRLTPDELSLVRSRGSDTLEHLLLVFNHYADWAVSVGVAFGLEDKDAQIADNWATSLPRTSQYLRGLSKAVSQCITRLSRRLQQDQGYNLGRSTSTQFNAVSLRSRRAFATSMLHAA